MIYNKYIFLINGNLKYYFGVKQHEISKTFLYAVDCFCIVYRFSITIVTNYHKYGNLKQHLLSISQFCRLEVYIGYTCLPFLSFQKLKSRYWVAGLLSGSSGKNLLSSSFRSLVEFTSLKLWNQDLPFLAKCQSRASLCFYRLFVFLLMLFHEP